MIDLTVIDETDVQVPFLNVNTDRSEAYKTGACRVEGALVVADGVPTVLYDPSDRNAEPVRFYVMSVDVYLATPFGQEFQRWALDDPAAPPDANKTYEFLLCVPSYDAVVPAVYTARKTRTNSALAIITGLRRAALDGEEFPAFELSTLSKTGKAGAYFVPAVRLAMPGDDRAVAVDMFQRCGNRTRSQLLGYDADAPALGSGSSAKSLPAPQV